MDAQKPEAQNLLAERFEANRVHLRAVAYRMLGSRVEADDAVQEAWLRLARSDAAAIENLGGWLTTVVARVCLDMLRGRKARREEQIGPDVPEPVATPEAEREALLADAVGAALLVVLETLSPAERLAFVLHDMFAVPFEQIAPVVDRSVEATRQLASRARRRVQGREPASDVDLPRQREVVDAFLAASHRGDFEALLTVLDPEVVFRADEVAARMGGPAELRGAAAVAATFKGRAQAARAAVVDGGLGLAVIFGGRLRIVLRLTIAGDRVTAIEAVADPRRIASFDVALLNG
jgi:RNA polymerase sigma-70 factor (ECF subfamily)